MTTPRTINDAAAYMTPLFVSKDPAVIAANLAEAISLTLVYVNLAYEVKVEVLKVLSADLGEIAAGREAALKVKAAEAPRDFTVITGGDYDFEVHAKGCADVKRKLSRFMLDSYAITGTDVESAIAGDVDAYDAQDQGWRRDHYHVLSCAKS